MTSLRQWHNWIGLFVAPSVLFFALTGAAQLFNLHEAHGNYQPPAIVEKLSSVHKDQVFAFGDHHPSPQAQSDNETPGAPQAAQEDDHADRWTLVLKSFFLVVALCLMLSTAFGIWMGLTQTRRKGLAWLLLLAGAIVPASLLII
jgi:hypothetical protein